MGTGRSRAEVERPGSGGVIPCALGRVKCCPPRWGLVSRLRGGARSSGVDGEINTGR